MFLLLLVGIALPTPAPSMADLDAAPSTVPVASLSPRQENIALEGRGRDISTLLARIDSLDLHLQDPAYPARADVAYRMAQLYLSTKLIKHRRIALDLLGQALELDPTLQRAGELRAATAHRMRYTGQARDWLVRLAEGFPGQARPHRLLGDFYFFEARRTLSERRFEKARLAYHRALELDPNDAASLHGFAASCLALARYGEIPPIAERLEALPGREIAGRLLGAAALHALELEEQAWNRFQLALASLDPAARVVFESGDGFLERSKNLKLHVRGLDPELLTAAMAAKERGWQPSDGVDVDLVLRDPRVRLEAVRAYWRIRNPRPTHISNRNLMEYWGRLVEADVLFSDPRSGARGWDSEQGIAWVRWGRPRKMLYMPPDFSTRFDELANFALPPNVVIPNGAIQIWEFELGHQRFSVLFEDYSYNAIWRATGDTALLLEAMSKAEPLLFDEGLDEEPSFRLTLDVAAFYRPRGRATLESYVAVQPLEAFGKGELVASIAAGAEDLALVEWAIFDAQERRLDYQRHVLDPRRRRAELHRQLGNAHTGDEPGPLLLQIAADLNPGDYRLAVDVTELRGGRHRAREMELIIPPRPPAGLSMSDLQLATAFVEYDGTSEIPREFVKHTFAVLPLADGVYPADAQSLFVYYEVYNLGVDTAAQTRFNVSYEVFRRADRERDDREALASLSHEGLSRVDPLSLTYLEERTGRSPAQHVVKGGRVDIGALGPGRYLLAVTVADLVGGTRVIGYAAFSKAKPRLAKHDGPG